MNKKAQQHLVLEDYGGHRLRQVSRNNSSAIYGMMFLIGIGIIGLFSGWNVGACLVLILIGSAILYYELKLKKKLNEAFERRRNASQVKINY